MTIFRTLLMLLLVAVPSLNYSNAQLSLQKTPTQSIIPNLQKKIGLQADTLLTPDKAFNPTIRVNPFDVRKLTIDWSVDPQYYLYKNKVQIRSLNKAIALEQVTLPQGIDHNDEFFGEQQIYDHDFSIDLILNGNAAQEHELYLQIEAQGCAKEGFCFAPYQWERSILLNPDIKKNPDNKIETPSSLQESASIIAEHDRYTNYLSANKFFAIPIFFFIGLLLTFTPCVLPMLPILSGILTGEKNISTKRGFLISLAYVLAMAVVYTALGLFAASMGKGLAAFMQHAYVLTAFSLIFVLLALSMFGFYTLQMPAAIQTKLSTLGAKGTKGSFINAAIMGALSALIVGPCITAPLIGIIGLIAQSQNYFLGGSALFSMSMGMGVPLLILGASSGHLLPKAGVWMDHITKLFGFILLGMAAYFMGRTLSHFWENMLYALVALSTFIWLARLALIKPYGKKIFISAALLLLGLSAYFTYEANRVSTAYEFFPIKGITGLNAALKTADNRITMLEFNADWCVSCKEMEKYVFSKETVKEKLSTINTLVADVTKNDAEDQALQKYFNIYGPPAMLFFDAKGNELPAYRIMGSVSAQDFIEHLEKLPRGL